MLVDRSRCDLMNNYSYLSPRARQWIGYWLLVVAAFVGAMTVIGGVTRLTESGLSMVEWRPLVGLLPPWTESEWLRVFDLYRQTPEYQKINSGMALEEFKEIFWWEFIHRVWGRLIGLVFAVPLLVFWLKGWIKPPLSRPLLVLLVLGGLQGLIGWWMVKSGLIDRPDVSHYRLAVHLSMAFLIAGLLIWTALGILKFRPAPSSKGLITLAQVLLCWVCLVIVFGAFVAGTDAGMVYTDFPLMNGRFLAEDIWALDPWWLNPIENRSTIQFIHRWAAILAAIATLYLWLRIRDEAPGARLPAAFMAVAVAFQVALGVATLVSVVWIPLAASHQLMGLFLFISIVWTLWTLRGDPSLR
jgi:cytochrome c oxidase assembly protein subunit 15